MLLLITIAIITFKIQSNKPQTIKPQIDKEKQLLTPKPETKQKVKIQEQTSTKQIKVPIIDTKIDFIGQNNPVEYSKTNLEIDQIMQEQKKINTYGQKKHPTERKEDWEVDYGVGLEDGAIDELKAAPTLKSEMLNGKIGFSKSF